MSLYTDTAEPTKFNFCQPRTLFDEYVLVMMVTPLGAYDGLRLRAFKFIYKIEQDDAYGKAIVECYHPDANRQDDWLVKLPESKEELLAMLIKRNCIVSLSILDTDILDITGFVTKVKDGICYVNQVDYLGYADGEAMVKVEDISEIQFESEDERKVQSLFYMRQATESAR